MAKYKCIASLINNLHNAILHRALTIIKAEDNLDFLKQLLDNSDIPVLTAFILGLLTAFNPCPLATNITAIAYISRWIEDRRQVVVSGLLYTLGRIVAYSLLGAVLIYIIHQGEDMLHIQEVFSQWGEPILGPVLILIGLYLFFGHKLHLHNNQMKRDGRFSGGIGAFLLGLLFAMAFCPASALFYFGMLIPMSASVEGGYFLPIVFAITTALPVILIVWLLAYSMKNLTTVMNRLQHFQSWFNRIIALLFIGIGIYFLIEMMEHNH